MWPLVKNLKSVKGSMKVSYIVLVIHTLVLGKAQEMDKFWKGRVSGNR